MAFWNKKNNDEDVNKKIPSEEMSAEMQAINAALEEEEEEKQAKARARAEENERIQSQQKEREEQTAKTASEFLSETADKKEAGGKRFYMLVDSLVDLEPRTAGNILVEGNVYGVLNKGDEVFIFKTDNTIVTATVEEIKTGPNLYADNARDKHCILELKGESLDEIGRFSLITNSEPGNISDGKKIPTNPHVLGLSLDFNRFSDDPDYFTVLINAIVKTTFVTHARIEVENADEHKGRIGILSLQDKNDPGKNLVPVFTDGFNMSRAKVKLDDKMKIVNLTFPQLATFATSPKHDGFVINPFGPVSIKIPGKLVEEITSNPNYIKTYGSKGTNNAKVVKEKISDKAQIYIGVPTENDEYRLISNAVIKYCQTNSNISKAGIVMKLEKGKNDPSYLCIVSCPKGTENECYTGLFASVKPFLVKNRRIEFMRYEETVFAEVFFSKQKLIYQRGL